MCLASSSFGLARRTERRDCSLQWPLDPFQLLACLGIFFVYIEFPIFTATIVHIHAIAPLCLIYLGMAVINFVTLALLALKNSIDPQVLKTENLRPEEKLSIDVTQFLFCSHCNSHVDRTSKHCKLCNKCVPNFDHHCRWLNVCIGKGNYRAFFVFLHNLYWTLVYSVLVKLYLVIDCIVEKTVFDSRVSVRAVFAFSKWYAHLPILIVFGIVLVLGILALSQLYFLHIRLKFMNMTTYQYVLHQRKKIEENKTKPKIGFCVSQNKIVDYQPGDNQLESEENEPHKKQQYSFKINISSLNGNTPDCSKERTSSDEQSGCYIQVTTARISAVKREPPPNLNLRDDPRETKSQLYTNSIHAQSLESFFSHNNNASDSAGVRRFNTEQFKQTRRNSSVLQPSSSFSCVSFDIEETGLDSFGVDLSDASSTISAQGD